MAIDGGGRVRPCDGEIVEFLQDGGGAYEEVFTTLCPRRPRAFVECIRIQTDIRTRLLLVAGMRGRA